MKDYLVSFYIYEYGEVVYESFLKIPTGH